MKPVVIIALAFVLLFIPVNVSAVDFVDSSGYTPSWAKGAEYHSVLLKCTEMVGENSRDGNWCFEWTAYVLDQGVENFPESTESTLSTSSVHNLSVRVCTENKLCAFPGEFLKYRNWDTFDDFSEIANVEFKEKIDDNTIKFFADGFGSKPLTYTLNLKTGIEKNSQYGIDRPFNLLEPIPMKIGQQVNRYMEGYYGSIIEDEAIGNLKEFGLMDIERTMMAGKIDLGSGDVAGLVYDKETGILIVYIEKYELDGIQYNSGMALIDTNIFSVPTKIISAEETNSIELGYIPEWVDELDKLQIIEECHKIAGTNPNEEKWCDDYFRSVLDTDIRALAGQEPEKPFHPTIELPQFESIPEPAQESESVPLSEDEFARFADVEVTDEPPIWVYGLIGLFVLFGIPGIIIWLIIRKIKQRRRKIDLSKSFNR